MNHKTTRIIGAAVIAVISLAGCGASPSHLPAPSPKAETQAVQGNPIHQVTDAECRASAPAIYSFLRDPVTQDIRDGKSGMVPSRDGKVLVSQTSSAGYLVSTKDCTLAGLSAAWGVDVQRYMGR